MLAEHKRFVGIAERLGEYHHNHSHLEARTVDAELRLRICAGIEVGEKNAVERLVHYSRYAQYQQRQGVSEHLPEHTAVEPTALGQRERQ